MRWGVHLLLVLAAPAAEAATLTGTVTWAEPREAEVVQVTADHHVCGAEAPILRRQLETGPGGVLGGVVVYLELREAPAPVDPSKPEARRERSDRSRVGPAVPGPGPEDPSKPEARRERSDRSRVGPALPGPGPEDRAKVVPARAVKPKPSTLELERKNCGFEPRALVATAPVQVRVRNSDPLLHTARLADERGRVLAHFGLPVKGQVTPPIRLPAPGLYHLSCAAGHGWAEAAILVLDHRHHARTDAAGRYVLSEVPPGRHWLVAWHPELGRRAVEVDVGAGVGEVSVAPLLHFPPGFPDL